MMHLKNLSTPAYLLALALLAGCETPVTATGKASAPQAGAPAAERAARAAPAASAAPATPVVPAEVALREGIEAYDNGAYNNAIKKLASPEIAKGSKAIQLSAIKYTAFSYCVSNRQTLCRQQFEKALKLDPEFELETGEAGHPLWGPVFARAKKGKASLPKSAKISAASR